MDPFEEQPRLLRPGYAYVLTDDRLRLDLAINGRLQAFFRRATRFASRNKKALAEPSRPSADAPIVPGSSTAIEAAIGAVRFSEKELHHGDHRHLQDDG
jgi:hypothetical protein